MRLLTLISMTVCLLSHHAAWANAEQQIKLEDIERDTLIGESKKAASGEKEDSSTQTAENSQHIQLTYSGGSPPDVYVTPQPGKYNNHKDSSPAIDLGPNIYHLPKVHEDEQTYTVPAKQSLIQPIIGGGQPIQPILTPQSHYFYVPAPHNHHTQYMPQAHAYVMVPSLPYAHQYASPTPIHHHSVLPTPNPTVFYSHGSTASPPQSYHHPAAAHYHQSPPQHHHHHHQSSPLKSAVEYPPMNEEYKRMPTIISKNALPPADSSTFQQFYSPGLEFHFTEVVPMTKLQYHHPGAPSPIHNYHATTSTSSNPAHHHYLHPFNGPSYNYFISSAHPTAFSSSAGAAKHHQSLHYMSNYKTHLPYHLKNYFPTAPTAPSSSPSSSSIQVSSHQPHHQPPQHPLFTPAQQTPHFTPYPSAQAYNTIQYSVPMQPYEHSKRSTSKATATLTVKAPKA